MEKIKEKIVSLSKKSNKQLENSINEEDLKILHNIKLYLDDIYYNTGENSLFSDYQYDMLKEILSKRDPNYIVPIGAKIRENENRVKLPYWLGSMDKYKPTDEKEINKWAEKFPSDEYIIEDKLDGVSCLLIIKNGKIKLYTRGDGIIGGDISYLSQYFKSIPKNLEEDIVVRGELIINKEIFNKKWSKEFANARNMVSGRIGGKIIREGINDINFVAYELISKKENIKPSEQFLYLEKLGFLVVNHEIIKEINVSKLIELFSKFRNVSEYQIDGIIIQQNKPYFRNTDGNPDYAFAFKMLLSDNIYKTKVINVVWNVSKWGLVKPIVNFEAVKLPDATISAATGFNAGWIFENKIGPGAIIEVTRSGDVIPYIHNVLKGANQAQFPEFSYKWNDNKVDIYTEDKNFENIKCIKLMNDFFAKLNVKNVGIKIIEKLYNGGLDTIIKIIAAPLEKIKSIDGLSGKLGDIVYNSVKQGLENVSISKIIGFSGIFGYGIAEKKVIALFNDFPTILDDYDKLSTEELYERINKIEGFSDKTTKKIINNLKYAKDFITILKYFVTFKEQEIKGNNLDNMKIVFSGFRDENLKNEIISRGGTVTTSVSKNTSYVIVAKKEENPSGKVKDAIKYNIEVLIKDIFINNFIK